MAGHASVVEVAGEFVVECGHGVSYPVSCEFCLLSVTCLSYRGFSPAAKRCGAWCYSPLAVPSLTGMTLMRLAISATAVS